MNKAAPTRTDANRAAFPWPDSVLDFVENLPDLVQTVSPKGQFLYVNRAWQETMGYTAREATRLYFLDVLHPGSRKHCIEIFRRLQRGQRSRNVEATFVTKSGRAVYVEGNVNSRFERGRLVHTRGVFRDVSERKQMEAALRESEKRYRVLVENNQGIVCTHDMRGNLTAINSAGAALLGFRPEDVLGRNLREFILPHRQKFFDEYLERIQKKETDTGTFNVRTRAGEQRTLLYRFTRYEEPGQDPYILGHVVDVTEQKKAEMALREVNSTLEAFSHSMCHDLRAPLRVLQGLTRALEEDYAEKLDAQGRDFAQRIHRAAGQMDTLIQELLTYSRTSRERLTLQPVNLTDVVREAIAHLEKEIRERKAQVNVAKKLPQVTGHRATLVQVVANLVSNALKFVVRGTQPRVHISAESPEAMVRLQVEDNGIGISPKDHERIFGAFERLHGSETFPGTGLGLATVRKGVERMGGRVGVESRPGRGSIFWIDLPRAKSGARR